MTREKCHGDVSLDNTCFCGVCLKYANPVTQEALPNAFPSRGRWLAKGQTDEAFPIPCIFALCCGCRCENEMSGIFFCGISPEPGITLIHLRGTRGRHSGAPGLDISSNKSYILSPHPSPATRERGAPQRRPTASPCDGFRSFKWFGRRCRAPRGCHGDCSLDNNCSCGACQ